MCDGPRHRYSRPPRPCSTKRCSCSKAIAAFAEPEFQACIIGSSLKAYSEHTKTTEADLRADFACIVERGFADCDQEIDLGIASLAAPVPIGNIGAIFSVGAVGPILRFGPDNRACIGRDLIELFHQDPDITLKELHGALEHTHGVRASVSGIDQVLKRPSYTYKKGPRCE